MKIKLNEKQPKIPKFHNYDKCKKCGDKQIQTDKRSTFRVECFFVVVQISIKKSKI